MAEQEQKPAKPDDQVAVPQAEPYPMNPGELRAKLKQQYPYFTNVGLEAFGP